MYIHRPHKFHYEVELKELELARFLPSLSNATIRMEVSGIGARLRRGLVHLLYSYQASCARYMEQHIC